MSTEDKKNLMELWTQLSVTVASSILGDDGAIFPIMEVLHHNAHWFAPKLRPIYSAALSCVNEGVPPSVETIAPRVIGAMGVDYLRTVAAQFNDDDNSRIVYIAEELREIGVLVKVKQLGKQLNEVGTPEDVKAAASEAVSNLNGLFADHAGRESDALAVDAAAWAMVEQFKGNGIPTGLGWFDVTAGGLWPGMNYWIVAAYKSGKSTVMRNMVLNAAKNGYPVSVMAAEGTREKFVLDCQSMLATSYLREIKYTGKMSLSGLFIMRSWTRHFNDPQYTPQEYEAILWAREQWKILPITVYDTRDGIRDLHTMQYMIKRDKLKRGTSAVFIDYSQLLGEGKTLYDRQSKTALAVQDTATNEMVSMVVLAQQNESQIRDGGNNYSAGVKGGGDASSAADFLFIPSIDPEQGDDTFKVLNIELKFSRHTGTGKGSHYFYPASGLIYKELKV